MIKKSKKVQIETISDGNDILLKSANKVLAEVIREKETTFRSSWTHFKIAEDDPEALHDMRVDLRRLRVWLKLTRDEVKTNKSACKQLKTLAKASNPVRDHEVILGWLSHAQKQIGESPELDRLIEYGKQKFQQSTALKFTEKQHLYPQAKSKKAINFGQWLDSAIEQRIEVIAQLLNAGLEEAHLARIEIKYLRYLLEPFTNILKNAKDLVEWSKQVQGVLGDIHDVQIFRSHLPDFARWVTDIELAQVAFSVGKQSKAIIRVFANARGPVIALSGWQDQELKHQWNKWLGVRDNYLLTLQKLRNNQNSVDLA